MGYAEPNEVIAALNELLEAERAGTRVALATRKSATSPEVAAFMRDVERDEAHWCAMLKEEIERLGGTPSEVCGAFYEKAMAIEALHERLAFLNRGQSWVVRKLDALRPRVRADALHGRLHEMSESHVANIAATEAMIERLSADKKAQ